MKHIYDQLTNAFLFIIRNPQNSQKDNSTSKKGELKRLGKVKQAMSGAKGRFKLLTSLSAFKYNLGAQNVVALKSQKSKFVLLIFCF